MITKEICKWILYTLCGWKREIDQPIPQKCVVCLAPHTSNWDFIIGQLYARAEGVQFNFLMKKEWFFWPLGYVFKRMGGIPVQRDRNTSLTDTLAQLAVKEPVFRIVITPEGTRSATQDWKRGFYYIAINAQIPILLFAADFEKKTITCTKTFHPTGDYDKDIIEIKSYYKGFKGKHPEKFLV